MIYIFVFTFVLNSLFYAKSETTKNSSTLNSAFTDLSNTGQQSSSLEEEKKNRPRSGRTISFTHLFASSDQGMKKPKGNFLASSKKTTPSSSTNEERVQSKNVEVTSTTDEQRQEQEESTSSTTSDDEMGPVNSQSIRDYIVHSHQIVMVKCRSSKALMVSKLGNNIFTFTKFDVLKVLKGNNIGNRITLRFIGGKVGNIEDIVEPDMPRFMPGEETVLLLGKKNMDGYPTFIFQFRINMDVNKTKKVVITPVNGIPMYNAISGLPHTKNPKTIYLKDFLYSLDKLLQGMD